MICVFSADMVKSCSLMAYQQCVLHVLVHWFVIMQLPKSLVIMLKCYLNVFCGIFVL